MVTMEHQSSSSEDHVNSHGPGPTPQAEEVRIEQSDNPFAEDYRNPFPMPDSLLRLKNIDSMTPEGRRDYAQQLYAKQLDLASKDNSATGSTSPEQLEVRRLNSELLMLQMRIREDEKRVAPCLVPTDIQPSYQMPGVFNPSATRPSHTPDLRLPNAINQVDTNTHIHQLQIQQIMLGPAHQKRSRPERVEHDNCGPCWSNRRVPGYKCPYTALSAPTAIPWPSNDGSMPALDTSARLTAQPSYYNPSMTFDPGSSDALQDYNMQLRLLEHQNKTKLMLAGQEQEIPNAPLHNGTAETLPQTNCHYPGDMGSGAGGNLALQDYQMQLMLLDQQNKNRAAVIRVIENNKLPSHDSTGPSSSSPVSSSVVPTSGLQNDGTAITPGSHSPIQHCTLQLSLLEQQNKERLQKERLEQDAKRPPQYTRTFQDSKTCLSNEAARSFFLETPKIDKDYGLNYGRFLRDSESESDEHDAPSVTNSLLVQPPLSVAERRTDLLKQQKKTPGMTYQPDQDVMMSDTGNISDLANKRVASVEEVLVPETDLRQKFNLSQHHFDDKMHLTSLANNGRVELAREQQEQDVVMTSTQSKLSVPNQLDESLSATSVASISDLNTQDAHSSSLSSAFWEQKMATERENAKVSGQQREKVNKLTQLHDDVTILRNCFHEAKNDTAQLMLLKQQIKPRLIMTRQDRDQDTTMVESGSNSDLPDRNPTTAPVPTTSTPTADLEAVREAPGLSNQTLADYQRHLKSLERQGKTKIIMCRQEQNTMSSLDPRSCPNSFSSNAGPLSSALPPQKSQALNDYQTYYMSPEEKHQMLMLARQEDENISAPDPKSSSHPLNYNPTPMIAPHRVYINRQKHMLTSLELKDKKRPKMDGRQERDDTSPVWSNRSCTSLKNDVVTSSAFSNDESTPVDRAYGLSHLQKRLRLQAQETENLFLMARHEEENVRSLVSNYSPPINSNSSPSSAIPAREVKLPREEPHTLRNYEKRIVLLEQEHKRRIMMAQQAQANLFAATFTSGSVPSNENPPSTSSSTTPALNPGWNANAAMMRQRLLAQPYGTIATMKRPREDLEMSSPPYGKCFSGPVLELPIPPPLATSPSVPKPSSSESVVPGPSCSPPGLQQYQAQFLELEKLNIKRIMQARQEQDRMLPPHAHDNVSASNHKLNFTQGSLIQDRYLEVDDQVVKDRQRHFKDLDHQNAAIARLLQQQEHTFSKLEASVYPTYNLHTKVSITWNFDAKNFNEAKEALSRDEELSSEQKILMMENDDTYEMLLDQYKRRHHAKCQNVERVQKDTPTPDSRPESLQCQASSVCSSPTSSSVVFTPESSASPQASEDEFNKGRPLVYRFAHQPSSSPF